MWDDEIVLNRSDYIKRADTTDTNLYFIESGCARVYITEDANEHSLYFGYNGSLISALDSFLSDKPSPLVIQCINKTRVHIISKTTFWNFMNENKEISTVWQEVLSELSLWHIEREKNLLISSPSKRYNNELLKHPLLFQHVPHKYIASYLRMAPETLSRILNS